MLISSTETLATPGEEFVRSLAISQLRTTYAVFRTSGGDPGLCDLKALPLRVVATDDGHFEIIDGFKRFEAWTGEGQTRVPVVIESPGTRAEHKRLLLLANRPRRTLNPLDEASVVSSLLEEDGLSVSAVAKLLGRGKEWVLKRRAFIHDLSERAQQALARSVIGPTLASHLTGLPVADQDAFLISAEAHALTNAERLALLHAWKLTKTAAQRRTLLENPTAVLKPAPAPTLSVRARQLEHQLQQVLQAVSGFRSLHLPADLPPAESRRLEALHRAVRQELEALTVSRGPTVNTSFPDGPATFPAAEEIAGSSHHDKEEPYVQTPFPISGSRCPRPPDDHRPGRKGLWLEEHCPSVEPVPQNRPAGARRAWPDLGESPEGAQDRSVSGADRSGRPEGPVRGANLSRDLCYGLSGRENDSRRPGSPSESPASAEVTTPHCQTTLRNSSGSRNAGGLVPGNHHHCREAHTNSPARRHPGPQPSPVCRHLPQ